MSVPEGWKESSLATMLEKLKDGTHFSPQICGGEFKYITSKNVKMGNLDLGNIQYIDEIQHKKIFRGSPVQYGDVLFTKDGANAGNVCLNTLHEEFSILSSVAILSGEKDVADNIFLLNLLMWDNTQAAIKNNVSGQAITRLTLKQIGELRFVFPPLAEQKKIAAILSTWDRAIESTDKLLENARQQKKALMQQLLTGRKRLPGFSGEWEVKTSRKVFKSVSTRRQNNEPLLSVTQDRGVLPRDMLERRVVMPEGSMEGYKLVIPGNFIISLRSFQGGIEYSAYRGLVSPAYTVLSAAMVISDEFYKQYFKSHIFIGQLAVAVIGIRDGKQVSYDDFSFLKIPLPPLPEQQAIARVLTTADKEIDALTQKAALLRQEKRALMQQLLTGKKRVRVEA